MYNYLCYGSIGAIIGGVTYNIYIDKKYDKVNTKFINYGFIIGLGAGCSYVYYK